MVCDFRLAQSVKVLVALSILFTYGLQFLVPSEIVWKKISPKINEAHHNIGYYIMRGLMILGTGELVKQNLQIVLMISSTVSLNKECNFLEHSGYLFSIY